ncbi:hypothetical protein HDU86_005119 [Geranomyces michiganensis]|nr:hypothetical protein HDU86_005119 [Geranomyces michiganensis]
MPASHQAGQGEAAHSRPATGPKSGQVVLPPWYEIRSPFLLDQNPVEFAKFDDAANGDAHSTQQHDLRSLGFLAAGRSLIVNEGGVVRIEVAPASRKPSRVATPKGFSAAAPKSEGKTFSQPKKRPIVPPPTFRPLASPFSQLGFSIFLHVQQFLLRFGAALRLPAHVFAALSNSQYWPPPAVTDAAYGLLEVILPRAPHLAATLASTRRTARWEVIASVIDPALYQAADPDADWADALAELRTLRTVNSLERVPFWCQLCCLHSMIEMLSKLAPDFIRDAIETSLSEHNVLQRQLFALDEIADKARTDYLDAVAAREAAAARKPKTKTLSSALLQDKKRAVEIDKHQQKAWPMADRLQRVRPQISALGVDAAVWKPFFYSSISSIFNVFTRVGNISQGSEFWSFPLHEAVIYKYGSQWPINGDTLPPVDAQSEWTTLDVTEAENLAQYLL